LAAYSAKANLSCHVVVPRIVDVGKLAQMIAYDAIIQEYGNTVDDSIANAEALTKETGWYQATAELNPFVIEAQKSISYEIFEQLGVPEWIIVSMGMAEQFILFGGGLRSLSYRLTSSFPKWWEFNLTDSHPY
jgi:threonine synthase